MPCKACVYADYVPAARRPASNASRLEGEGACLRNHGFELVEGQPLGAIFIQAWLQTFTAESNKMPASKGSKIWAGITPSN